MCISGIHSCLLSSAYIYIYIYMCVCGGEFCVCVVRGTGRSLSYATYPSLGIEKCVNNNCDLIVG